jgi:DNA invertase Pin-like site-specific DNA recombinase
VVVAEMEDPSSASRYATKARKNWARVLELLPEVDVVVLWEPSRGDRTLASWAGFLDACRQHKVKIHAVSHSTTYDLTNPRHYRSLAEDGVDSAYESDKISQRVRRGQASAALAGRPHGSKTYGYERRYDPATRAFVTQVEHTQQAPVVRDIVSAVARGETLTSISNRLTRSVPAPHGGPRWRLSTVRVIATNPAYRGVRIYDGQEYPALWPALVEDAVWFEAQRVLGETDARNRKARRTSPPGGIRYLLSGSMKVMTSPCGNPLTGNADKPGRAAYYLCSFDACVSAPVRDCDEYLARLIVARMSRPDVRDLWVNQDEGARKAADELARLEAELEDARMSFATPGGISPTAMAAKEQAMAPAIEDARLRARPSGLSLGALELMDTATLGHDLVRPAWDNLPLPTRREVISGLFDELVLGKSDRRVTRHTTAEQRLEIAARRIHSRWREPQPANKAA